MKISGYALIITLWLSGCATSVPVAGSCPPAPLPPAVLLSPPSTGTSLIERYSTIEEQLRNSLKKAIRPE